MDALLEARKQTEQVLVESVAQTKAIAKAFTDLGGDPSAFMAQFGQPSRSVSGATSSGPSRARRSSPARRRSSGNGGSTAAAAVTAEQVLGFLRESGPANQSMIAKAFGTTRQTIAKRLDALGGTVIRDGQVWRAAEQEPAAS